MIHSLIAVLLTFTFQMASAATAGCTDWALQADDACVVGGTTASLWLCQCDRTCSISYRSGLPAGCNLTDICSASNPDFFAGPCSPWTPDNGKSCFNPSTGNYEQAWVRSCQLSGYATTWCSDRQP